MPNHTASLHPATVAAIVAAAGRSTRMGEPKQLLPWGERTVLGSVVHNLADAGASPVLCVVGHRADAMAAALGNAPAHLLLNPDYLVAEMLRSYQVGVRHLLAAGASCLGTLLALGDQPHIPVDVIRQVVEQARTLPDQIVIPSYELRRGHPFYLPAHLWPELVALSDETPPIIDHLRQRCHRRHLARH
jgi:molybdenum cofactor cytidylyltransferase